jgi:hypothetical protein
MYRFVRRRKLVLVVVFHVRQVGVVEEEVELVDEYEEVVVVVAEVVVLL